jgi:hypothetical protein
VSIYHFKHFPGASPGPSFKGQRREGREEKGKQGRGGKERGWDMKVREGSIPK